MASFTAEQEKAINLEGKDILVSASAGAGKTTVLVERILRKIETGTSIDQLLVVTFTRAAAEEMKNRIKSRLTKQLAEHPSSYLRQQLNLIDTANISTIDSFCLDVIKRFYYTINLDPGFSLLTDEVQHALLQNKALKEVEAELIQQKGVQAFYDNFAGDRDADAPEQLLLDLYNQALTRPNYRHWLKQLNQAYQSELTDSDLFQNKIKTYLLTVFSDLDQEIDLLLQHLLFQSPELAKMKASFIAFQKQLKRFLSLLKQNAAYDQLQAAIKQCVFTGRHQKSQKWDDSLLDLYEQGQHLKDRAKDLVFDCYSKFFVANKKDLIAVNQKAASLTQTIVQVELQLIDHFKALKQKAGFLDFSDLEQLTWKILQQDTSSSNLARKYYQNKFKEILIDEYQDINPLQENILQKLKGENNILFMVGDVKQSIYGFRQADSRLFLEKYHDYAQNKTATRIILKDNFRSSKNIISTVNQLFNPIMTTNFGGLDYQKEGALKFGATYYPKNLPSSSEFIYQEKDNNSNQEEQNEIQLVIKRIKQLRKENFQVYDSTLQKQRPFRYSDIAILTRSHSDNLAILQAFYDAGIPLFLTDVANYFQTFELTIIINYLKLIDNPDQDIPLVSVLRSPIFNFNEKDLAQIRIKSPDSSFYSALSNYVSYHDDLSQRIKIFLNQLENLRDFATTHRISELVWEVYERTNLLEIMTAMPNGEQRRVNLEALYERSSQFESAGFKGLYQFITFINRVREDEKDLAQPLISKDANDSVHLMTIHGAKGLEFPIVFYLGADHQFQLRDLNQDYLITQQFLGLTVKLKHFRVDSWLRSWAEIQKKQQSLEEESRILYVALTRAKQKLIIVANIRNPQKRFSEWTNAKINEKLPLNQKLNAKNALDLLAPSFPLEMPASQISDIEQANEEKPNIQIYQEKGATVQTQKAAESTPIAPTSDNNLLKDTASKLFNFSYPFTDAVKTAAYQSVSEIKRTLTDPDEEELQNAHLISSHNRYNQKIEIKPQFLYQNDFTGAQIGTAMHMILQYFDYHNKKEVDLTTIKAEVATLVKKKKLSAEIVPHLPLAEILWFVTSKFASKFWQMPEKLHREEDFSSLILASRIHSHFSDRNARILIHGTIDGYFEDQDGIRLFDYKTDFVDLKHHAQAIANLKKKYSSQLALYEQALNSYQRLKVKHKYLVLLNSQEIIELTD